MSLSTLIQASVQGGLVILVLFLGLKLAPGLSPKVRVWLWRFVFVKLALSLLPLGAISLKILPAAQEPVQAVNSSLESEGASPEPIAPRVPSREEAWVLAWMAGATVASIISFWRARSCHEAAQKAVLAADASLQGTVSAYVGKLGCREPLVMVSGEVPTAVVMGSRCPRILLPEDMEKSQDLRLILAHEVVHVAHRDLEWNAFSSLVECLFFFHPLVWLAARSVNEAQEAAADAAAIRLTNTSPKRYGEMLMRATLFTSQRPAGALSLGASTGRIRTRLNDLRHINAKPTLARFVAGTVLSLAVIAMTPAYQLASRDAKVVPGHPSAAMAGHEEVVVWGQSESRHSRTRATRSRSRVSRSRRQSGRIRVARPKRGARGLQIEVVPAVAPSIAVSVRPAVARGISVAVAATPARALSVSVAPQVATSLGARFDQGRGRSYSRPVRAASMAPQAAVSSASRLSDATSPSSSHSVSVSVSSGGAVAPAAGVSVASNPSDISASAAPAVATSSSAASDVSTGIAPAAARAGRTIRVKKGVGHGFGKGTARGAGTSFGGKGSGGR